MLILTGIDWSLAKFYNSNEVYVWMAAPFVLGGMFIPIMIIGYYLLKSKSLKQEQYQIQFKRSLYSFIFTYVLMTVLQVFTNRIDMEPFEPIGTVDTSGEFRFGFMNSNSWWESLSEGWPSGHTMIAVSMAIAINPLIERSQAKWINWFYAILVSLSVSTAFHWLSDIVSGSIMGVVIGLFYSRYKDNGPNLSKSKLST